MKFNSTNAYKKSKYSSEFFLNNRTKLEQFHKSEKYFINIKHIDPEDSLLDIGCASGGLGNALLLSVSNKINYTGIDVDNKAIELGRKYFEDINLICGEFPTLDLNNCYDGVIILNLFDQIPDWKGFLLSAVNYADKYVNFGVVMKTTGTTVIDKDVSYGYYYDSGERVHKIVHNIYELINFCSIHEMRAKKISFYGYHTNRLFENIVDYKSVPEKEQIRGNIHIELLPKNQNFVRSGSFPSKESKISYTNIENSREKPEYSIIIDNKEFQL